MNYFEVAKTIYLNNGEDEYFKYEIIIDDKGEVSFVMVYMEVKLTVDNTTVPIWSKLEDVTLDHLMPPKHTGFQTDFRINTYPGKSISTAIDVCKDHRKKYK
jgi:hypothetical protein